MNNYGSVLNLRLSKLLLFVVDTLLYNPENIQSSPEGIPNRIQNEYGAPDVLMSIIELNVS